MMYLIDTHILLWYMSGDIRLSKKIIRHIENIDNNLFVSKASLWEIAIKVSTGKLRLSMPIIEIGNYLNNKFIAELDFNLHDLDNVANLPFHHNDPFDRLIKPGHYQKLHYYYRR